MKYKRVLLKLSGESLEGQQGYGIDSAILNQFAMEIKSIVSEGVEVGVVLGGGNIFRGMQGVGQGFDRVQGDYMGMLATTINSMALQSALEAMQVPAVILSGLPIEPICAKMSRRNAIEYIKKGYVVIMCCGTGNPYFTTDSGAALRGIEIKADVLLKGTRVDGVYTADPEKDPTAVKFDEISFSEVYEKKLRIMDLTAFALCQENGLPILVFDMNQSGNLKRIVAGEKIGTLIK